jgi:hypothetical protein
MESKSAAVGKLPPQRETHGTLAKNTGFVYKVVLEKLGLTRKGENTLSQTGK